jgi:gas vesicle protein
MNIRRPIYVPATSLVALPKNKDSDLVCILYDGAIYVFDRSCSPYKAKGWYKKQDAKEIATIWWSKSEEISYLVKEGSDTQTINLESLDPEIPPDIAEMLLSPKSRTDVEANNQNGKDSKRSCSCGKSLQELKTENDQLHLRIGEATAALAQLRPPHTDKIAQLYIGLSNQIKNWVLESFDDFEDNQNRGFESMLSSSIARYPEIGAIVKSFQLETLKRLESSLASELWQYKHYGLMAIIMRYVCEAILSEPLSIVRESKKRLLEATFQSLTALDPPRKFLPLYAFN